MFATVRPLAADPERPDVAGLVDAIVEQVTHLLPEQAPLTHFVHHNPLHAFEPLPFQEAVGRAARVLGTEPFQSERQFAEHLGSDRIRPADLRAVLAPLDEVDGDAEIFPGGPLRREFRFRRLATLFEIPRGTSLRWTLDETGARHRCHPLVGAERRADLARQASVRFDAGTSGGHRPGKSSQGHLLADLWTALEARGRRERPVPAQARRQDQILRRFAVDTDELVHPLLIRLCAAFLDQGVALWPMPDRADGLLAAFRRVFGQEHRGRGPVWRGLDAHLCAQQQEGWSADRTVRWALQALELPESRWPAAIEASLLSLRGWAGMVRQYELRPDLLPVPPVPARLVDYLAVQLTLEAVATRNVLVARLGAGATPADLDRHQPAGPGRDDGDLSLAYEAFVLAQLMDIDVARLTEPRCADAWLDAVADFDEPRRRWLLHLAYERRFRVAALDALCAHSRRSAGEPAPSTADFRVLFCMDEREESLRRHLEECHPGARTYGAAGFFGVAMAYQGLDDARPRALCPVTVEPGHLVVERAVDEVEHASYRRALRRYGRVRRALSTAQYTLGRGAALTTLLGPGAAIPLVGRCLFPRTAEPWAHHLRHRTAPRPRTRLTVERPGPAERPAVPAPRGGRSSQDGGDAGRHADSGPRQIGFTVPEMVDIVGTMLTTIGVTASIGPVMLVVGHASSSLNNPHEAAHDCGATGGGQGGPNARAFAAMANHPAVRSALAARGVDLGRDTDTWFVGAQHNTADESVVYYDTDLVPEPLRGAFDLARRALAEACRLDAHERSRRFESASLGIDADDALAHVERHSRDIGQPRPEYGHASNALCIIGRRARTRGLYLDRRAFLVSYDPTRDDDGSVLTRLLLSTGPVAAGISLEYYFSYIDPVGYGAGTKLPHNITGLLGVMDGHASDLRTGLPWQMVEIHEPMRLLLVAEATPARLARIVRENPTLRTLVDNGWLQLAAWDPDGPDTYLHVDGTFRPHHPDSLRLPRVVRSADHYTGERGHLGFAEIVAHVGERPATGRPHGSGAVPARRAPVDQARAALRRQRTP
jgi:uncharacterized protein YbcC (UPF0753/DUF2309 family)